MLGLMGRRKRADLLKLGNKRFAVLVDFKLTQRRLKIIRPRKCQTFNCNPVAWPHQDNALYSRCNGLKPCIGFCGQRARVLIPCMWRNDGLGRSSLKNTRTRQKALHIFSKDIRIVRIKHPRNGSFSNHAHEHTSPIIMGCILAHTAGLRNLR